MTENKNTIKPRPGLSALLEEKRPQMSTEEKALLHCFWRPIFKKSTVVNNNGVEEQEMQVIDIKIDFIDFYELLYADGFRRFEYNDDVFFVRIINDRILKRVRAHHIQDAITLFIKQLPETLSANGIEYRSRLIESAWVSKQDLLLNERRLNSQLRPREEIVFNHDTSTEKFMYFRNGYLLITADRIRFRDYGSLNGFIWESELIRREFKFPKNYPDKDYVSRFMFNISGKDPVRFHQLRNIVGYLMHNFVKYKRKAVMLTDGVIDTEGNANGRSGKSLLADLVGGAISHDPKDPAIRSYININGKDFDPTDKHKYSTADLDTKLIVINDLKRMFDVDILFNDITEGLTVDKKSLQPFRIEPKLILTTNKTVKVEGGSAKDRFIEFELSDHYSENFSPEQEFGHWFFSGWNIEDYCRYYQFMATCAQIFLKDGALANPKAINLNKRKLIENTHLDFLDFVETEWKPIDKMLYEKSAIYNQFLAAFPDWKSPGSKMSQNRFSIWVRNLMNFSDGWKNFKPALNDVKGTDGGRTVRYYKFIRDEESENTDIK